MPGRRVADVWDRFIARARALAGQDAAASPLLTFYADVLDAQAAVERGLRAERLGPSPSLAQNLSHLRPHVAPFLHVVARSGPQPLADEARRLLDAGDPSTIDDLLLAYWHDPQDRQFFAKALLQPYGQWLAGHGVAPDDRPRARAGNCCPFCGGAPQLSVLHEASDLQGGGRLLLCANCLTTWPFRRVICAFCGEEDDRKLGYFHTPEFDHLRVDGCDSCRHYLKTVDLTRLGLAVPLVDEVAGATLDVWARDHGYTKIELNLVGL